jgi:hypothetical protein
MSDISTLDDLNFGLSQADVARVVEASFRLDLADQLGHYAITALTESIDNYKQMGNFGYLGFSASEELMQGDTTSLSIGFIPKYVDDYAALVESSEPDKFDFQYNFALLQAVRGAQGLIVAVESAVRPTPEMLLGITNPGMVRLAKRFGFVTTDEYLAIETEGEVPSEGEIDDLISNWSVHVRILDSIRMRKNTLAETETGDRLTHFIDGFHDAISEYGQSVIFSTYDNFKDSVLAIPKRVQNRLVRLALRDIDDTPLYLG